MRIRLFFAWYDFWVGVFVDRKKNTLYICPLPMVVIRITIWGPHCYVVLKRGYFYRPEARGYTANVAEAGRFTYAEACCHACPFGEPVTMEHISLHLK